jgi:hypothetical protein
MATIAHPVENERVIRLIIAYREKVDRRLSRSSQGTGVS